MTGQSFYNEIDPFAASWLEKLIAAGAICPGVVDRRDIRDIKPSDLDGFEQCHFFAGIGGWSYALRLADWPDARPVWTGSCPCQPFSTAGRGGGFADERHLWPAFFHLIGECRPATVFGEQVASRAGLAWFDLVHADMEGAGYAVGAADLCAAGVGAPHIRQRLWWVANATGSRHDGCKDAGANCSGTSPSNSEEERGGARFRKLEREGATLHDLCREGGTAGKLGNTNGISWRLPEHTGRPCDVEAARTSEAFWTNIEWLSCRDGKARPTQPGLQPLAHGVPNRVGTLRGAGNAIVPQVAAEFVKACA